MNFADTIASHADQQPDVPALIDGERVFTYRDLDVRGRQGAALLSALGVHAGDHVAICLGDNADHVIAFLAVVRLGAVAVPIDWRASKAEQMRVARGLAAKLVLIDPAMPPLGDLPSHAVHARWYAEAARRAPLQEFPHDADRPLMIGLTSGTTGTVKGMVVTHRQMHARTLPFDTVLSPRRHRYLSASPLAFSAGRGYCLTHLIRGDTVVFHPALFSADEYVEIVTRNKATVAFVVPTVLRWMLQLPRQSGPLLPDVEALIIAGAPSHAEEKREAAERVTPNLYEIYGAVGAGPISVLQPTDLAQHAASVGRPAATWQIEIVDETDRPVAPGASGLLRLAGPGLASGLYRGAGEAAAAEGFRGGWYYTGDIASLDDAGFLYLKGRASDVILRGGTNVYPDEIEAVLLEHRAVVAAGVVGRRVHDLGEEVVAFVALGAPAEVHELIAHCRAQLAAYKVPVEITVVPEVPRTSFGKTDRRQLRSLAERDAAGRGAQS